MRYRAAVLSEYGLLVALIAVVAVAGVTVFGGFVGNFFACLPGQLGLDKNVKSDQSTWSVKVGTGSSAQTVTCSR